ncbi:MAG: hypothetical protein RR107_01935 [Clostridia bacterium]
MERNELFSNKQFLDMHDIKEIFKCGNTSAYAIIKSIKAKSDTLELKGKVTLQDYEIWLNQKVVAQ